MCRVIIALSIAMAATAASRRLCKSAFDSVSCVCSYLPGYIHDLLAKPANAKFTKAQTLHIDRTEKFIKWNNQDIPWNNSKVIARMIKIENTL
jgi:hypothetical protein